jgi:esterase
MPNPTPLHHTLISADGAVPEQWMLFLHGVFGQGLNFRTMAKRLVARCPSWGIALCDLRGHGMSQGFPAPHTIDAAAADVYELGRSLEKNVQGIAGHSLGGKVTLAYLEAHPGEMSYAFSLDSLPGARPNAITVEDAANVLRFLENIPVPLATRDAFFDLAKAAGMSTAITEWLAMNVRRESDGFRLRLDLPVIRSMLLDYYERDLWDAVSNASVKKRLDLIVAGDSSQYSPEDIVRAREISASEEKVHVTLIEGAGHWVHVDAPDALLEAMASALEA